MSPIMKISILFGIVVAILAQQCLAKKITLCVEDEPSRRKCEKMAAHVKDNELACLLDAPCIGIVARGKADFTVLNSDEQTDVLAKLEQVLFESFDDANVIVAVIKADKVNEVDSLPFSMNEKDLREIHAALYINHFRLNGVCQKVKHADNVDTIDLMRYHELTDKTDKKLVCVQGGKIVIKPVDQYKDCHVEANIPNAVMMKKGSSSKDTVISMMKSLAEGQFDDFKLFGPFEGNNNLIFSDETKAFVTEDPAPNSVTVTKFLELHCGRVQDYHP